MKVYYHDDLDGRLSGAIVQKKYLDLEIDFVPGDYSKEYGFNGIKPGETVIIVDFSFSKQRFQELLQRTKNVIWIDHHKSSIEAIGDMMIRGKREIGRAGCDLTWEYFFPDEDRPIAVQYVNDYDVWLWRLGEKTEHFIEGLKTYNTLPNSSLWAELLNKNEIVEDEVLSRGAIISKYIKQRDREYNQRYSGTGTFEGYKAVFCNIGLSNSKIFDSIPWIADIKITFVYDMQIKRWRIGIYTDRDDIDLTTIAEKYKGGGHRKSCGFTIDDISVLGIFSGN